MTTQELCAKWGLTEEEVEILRAKKSGVFGVRAFDAAGNSLFAPEDVNNIVTNQGLDYILDAGLSGGTQISAWRVTMATNAVTPLATHTYQAKGFTEVTGGQVSEGSRQTWTDGGVTGQSVDNSASPAIYTATATFTAHGAALVGGGAAPGTFGDVDVAGRMYAYAQFASSKALTATDTIEITYTLAAADDGV
jgi:hypothetical protein